MNRNLGKCDNPEEFIANLMKNKDIRDSLLKVNNLLMEIPCNNQQNGGMVADAAPVVATQGTSLLTSALDITGLNVAYIGLIGAVIAHLHNNKKVAAADAGLCKDLGDELLSMFSATVGAGNWCNEQRQAHTNARNNAVASLGAVITSGSAAVYYSFKESEMVANILTNLGPQLLQAATSPEVISIVASALASSAVASIGIGGRRQNRKNRRTNKSKKSRKTKKSRKSRKS